MDPILRREVLPPRRALCTGDLLPARRPEPLRSIAVVCIVLACIDALVRFLGGSLVREGRVNGRGYYGVGGPRVGGTQRRQFKLGDRVTLAEYPAHDPYHYRRNATVVKIVPGPAYGLLIDGMESMGTHKWYVGDELVPADEPQKRTIGPVVLVPDLVMLGLGVLGVVSSRFVKSEGGSMATLMVGAMVGATGLHGAIMRVTQGALKAEVNYPPPRDTP